MTSKLTWIGEVECEGGPLMLAAPGTYAKWKGSLPYQLLAQRFPDDPRFADRRKTLHYWGQFSDRLPEPFRQDGGHVFKSFATGAEAAAQLEALSEAILTVEPGITVTHDEMNGQRRFVTPDGRFMTAELSPASEYDAAWQEHEGEMVWTHPVGDGQATFFDIEGPGTAYLAVADDQILVVQTWLSGDDDTEQDELAAIRDFVTAPRESEEEHGELTLTGARVCAVWSPIAWVQLGHASIEAYEAALAGDGVVQLDSKVGNQSSGIGQCFTVKPGHYRITRGHTDEEEGDDGRPWSCLWYRLARVGD